MELNVEAIKQLISCLDHSSVDALRLETEQFKLCLKKEKAPVLTAAAVPQQAAAAPALQPAAAPEAKATQNATEGKIIKAPIVGTFYRQPAPDKPVFSEVGQKVKKGDVLFIIESMKLMNEITSETDGTVAEFLVESGQPVEYGQPIMRIE